MADYEGVYGYQDGNYQTTNISATALYPKGGGHHSPGSNTYHGVVDIDTATIVSIASSCIILISGCIAVVCLIMYMKKTDMLYRSRTCAKCGAHVSRDESANSRGPFRNEGNPAMGGEVLAPVAANITFHPVIEAHQNVNKNLGSMAIFRGFGEMHDEPSENKNNFPFGSDIENDANSMLVPTNSSGKQPLTGEFMKSAEFFDDPNEPTPYATFNLPGFDKDSKIGEVYETFTAKFTEPPYHLLKRGLECPAPPQYADSVDYKMRLIENANSKMSEDIYQATGLSQCHSVASSNTSELLRAYEYGKQQKQRLLKLQDEFIECLNENDNDDTCYLPSDRESPTDPGIREFTKSPPKPNEKRQGIVFHHHQPTVAEMMEISKQMIASNEGQFNINQQTLEDGDHAANDKNDLSPNETSNSFSSIQGSSSEARSTTSNDDSTPSAGSESGNGGESSSSSTATPVERLSDEDRQANFGAIPRDRSRNPSWASFTTLKSNTVLAPQYPVESQLAGERVHINKSSSTIKEGLSSDEDDELEPKANVEFVSRSHDLLEDIYSTRMAVYGARGSSYAAGGAKTSAIAGNSRATSAGFHSSQGPSQMEKSGVLFPGTSATERLPGMANRDFNRTAL